jgi:hypothetical protein
MDVFRANSGQDVMRPLDARFQPTPDYGMLSPDPGAEFPSELSKSSEPESKSGSYLRVFHVAAIMAGIGLAFAVSAGGGMGTVLAKLSSRLTSLKNSDISLSSSSSPHSKSIDSDLDRQKPQKQAEMLLERAVTRSDGATNQIITNQITARVDSWRGKLKWDAHLGELMTVALNSNDEGVRDSAIEVQLAAYGLIKSHSTVDALVKQANSSNHSKKIWAFWSLGLLANRGVETDRVIQVLAAHLKNPDPADNASEDSRRWALESLALVGTTPTIAPLLDAMRNDPSSMVRERAACSLAESGMLTHDQRLMAVPQLIDYSDDPALDAQTRGWAFQALADITQQRLPNDSAAWRNWYQNNAASN